MRSSESPGEVAAAIELLYATFGSYRAPPEPELSPLKQHLIEQARALHSARLRDIDAEALRPYAFSALATWGGVEELKHFLPRIFELLGSDPGWTDPAMLIGKLGYAKWREWPERERAAVDRFLDAWFRELLESDEHVGLAGDLLLGLAIADSTISRWIEVWAGAGSRNATRHLAELVALESATLCKRGLVSRSWVEPARTELSAWLRSAAVASRLEEAFLAAPSEPGADEIAAAFDVLSRL